MVVEVRVSVPCVCTQRPGTALAYALTVWSAMAGVAKSSGEQGKNRVGLTVGVVGDRMAMQWRFDVV